ncbi:MAG TPA: HipA family kinase [Chryseolinea sp.]|nr:HipA family kinase [Chryseolinea sp.]
MPESEITTAMPRVSTLRSVNVTRYVTPLREGGSLPAIVEADDEFLYVLKFRGSGQGTRALLAELIGGEIARALGIRVPEIVFAQLDSAFGRIEGDEEIQDLLKASSGLNLGLHYLSGAVTFDPLATPVSALHASQIVWLDALLLNVDRTVRNTNMLWWHKELWLIDHGASLYIHHNWQDWQGPEKPFPYIKDHVLLRRASDLDPVNKEYQQILVPSRIEAIVNLIPDEWLTDNSFASVSANRDAYTQFLNSRIAHASYFLNEARDARARLI